jgi:uncharacterized protein (TIGR04222 family)
MDAFNPLDLPGPQFLLLFGVLTLAGGMLSVFLRRRVGPAPDDTTRTIELDPFELAHLAGGDRLALNTALASLFRRGLVNVDAEARKMSVRSGEPVPFDLHPIERQAYTSIEHAGSPDVRGLAVATSGSTALAATDERLRARGLRFGPGEYAPYGMRAAIPILAVLALGALKIAVGLLRERPVSILVVLTVVLGVFALWVMFSAPSRTPRGSLVLDQARQRHAALESTATTAPQTLGAPQLAMALALFGPAVLIGSEFDPLRSVIAPPGSNGGSSCSGGSSSSSCSGGDSGGSSGCGGCGGGGGD